MDLGVVMNTRNKFSRKKYCVSYHFNMLRKKLVGQKVVIVFFPAECLHVPFDLAADIYWGASPVLSLRSNNMVPHTHECTLVIVKPRLTRLARPIYRHACARPRMHSDAPIKND